MYMCMYVCVFVECGEIIIFEHATMNENYRSNLLKFSKCKMYVQKCKIYVRIKYMHVQFFPCKS